MHSMRLKGGAGENGDGVEAARAVLIPYAISMHISNRFNFPNEHCQTIMRQGCCILVNQHAKNFCFVAFVLSRHC